MRRAAAGVVVGDARGVRALRQYCTVLPTAHSDNLNSRDTAEASQRVAEDRRPPGALESRLSTHLVSSSDPPGDEPGSTVARFQKLSLQKVAGPCLHAMSALCPFTAYSSARQTLAVAHE